MPLVDPDIFNEASFQHSQRSRRYSERRRTSLGVAVRGCDAKKQQWLVTGHLVDASRSGARIILSHKVEACQLVHLTVPMPAELRCFDETARDYRVWALVRSVNLLEMVENDTPQYEIGVAFIGKTPPESYKKDPLTRYEPLPAPSRDGLWPIREKARS